MNERFLKYIPDPIFAFLVNVRNQKSAGEHIKIARKNGSWWIMVGNIELCSPTSKFTSFGMKHFEEKFEQVVKIEPTDRCLDVGACIGDTTVPMCKKGKIVTALEPCPRNFHYLKMNTFRWLPLLHNFAITAHGPSMVPFHLSGAITGHSVEKSPDREDGFTFVQGVPLDFFENFDFAKIDVQGHEQFIFEENATLFLKSARKLVIETHKLQNGSTTLQPVLNAVKPYYKNIRVTDDRMVHCWK